MRRYSNFGRNRYKRKNSFFKRTSLTNLLIYVNVLFFILVSFWVVLSGGVDKVGAIGVLKYIALSPSLFFQGYVWTLLTSMFMHGGFTHLFVNMVSMFFIGNLVEKIIGRKRFLWFYFIAGIIAGLTFIGLAYLGQFIPGGVRLFGGVDAFAVGASGALFGLGGLLAVLIPRLKVLVFFILPMPMWAAMAVLMFGLWAISAAGNLPIGNTAHFGGLLVGLVYGFYLRKKYPRKIDMINRAFVQ